MRVTLGARRRHVGGFAPLHNFELAMLLASLTTSCLAQRQSKDKPYAEDLSHLRPKFEIVADSADTAATLVEVQPAIKPVRNVNDKVDAVLDSIDRLNVTRRFLDGYTIQIYSGLNREDANNAKKKMIDQVPELVADLQYIQPKFRVRVGNYFSRIEAQKDLVRLKRHFPNAILIPEKIPMK